MIQTICLGNFKAFAETQRVPLRPITLIYGPNSAGKSSIIHSLALVHHAMRTGELDVHRTEIGGESIDLGGFRQYVHRRDATKRFEWSVELNVSNLSGRVAELLSSVGSVRLAITVGTGEIDERQRTLFGELSRVPGTGVRLETCTVSADDQELLSMSARRGGILRVDRLHQEHPVLRDVLKGIVLLNTTTEQVGEQDLAGIDKVVDQLVPLLVVKAGQFLPRMEATISGQEESLQSVLLPVGKADRTESLGQAVRMFLPRALRDLVNGVVEAAESALGHFRYLGPLRSYPPRHLAFVPHHDPNWNAGGGFSWDVLRRSAEVRGMVNLWLSAKDRLQTPYELRVRDLIDADQLDEPLLQGLEKLEEDGLAVETEPGGSDEYRTYEGSMQAIIQDAEEEAGKLKDRIKESLGGDLTELIMTDLRSGTPVSHRDVGIGVSQVLPVLVSAYAASNQLIAIEQPEIHVHPKLQAELGDVFIESALGDRHNTFMLETHSEHLLLRIMKRMRQTFDKQLPTDVHPIGAHDVMVLYVEPDGSRSIVREMPLNDRGELVKAWPGGFFEEGLQEVF